MNRLALLERLTEARKYAGRGEILIATQKRIIETLAYTWTDTVEAERTLEAFEQSQDLRLGKIDHLLDALDKLPPVGNDPKS